MEGNHVLIVIDDPAEQERITKMCAELGGEAAYVNSPKDVNHASLSKYDMLIIDIDPPNNEATKLCEHISKASHEIFIVGIRSSNNQNVTRKIPCNAQLLKPLSAFVIEMVLEKV